MKKIKILFVGYGVNLGGIETYIYNLVCNSTLKKFDFSFLIFDTGQDVIYYKELIKMGCHFYKIPKRTSNYINFLRALKKVYKNNDFDYIHFNLMDLACFERITYAKKYSRAKIIIHSHCGSSEGLNKKNILSRLLHFYGKKLIYNLDIFRVACGEKAGKWMFKDKNFIIFNNGIDIDKFKFNLRNRNEIRKKLKINDDKFVIGLVAKLDQQKNPLFLLKIFKEYKKIDNNSVLVIVGEGNLRNEVEKYIRDNNLERDVLLTGKRYDANKFYSTFDILVMPSLYEGLSITMIEAQVNGLKCYTSNNVDKNTDITKNVDFLSLEKDAKFWADYIYNNNNNRDRDVLDKIPNEFNAKKSYEEVYKFYMENINF